MKKKFKVGDRVVAVFNFEELEFVKLAARYSAFEDGVFEAVEEIKGKINKVYSSNVDVVWDSGHIQNEVPARLNKQFLMLEKDYKAEKATLELAFKVLKQEVKDKLTKASKLVKEANKLAKKDKLEMKVIQGVWAPLLDEMYNAGWNASNCW